MYDTIKNKIISVLNRDSSEQTAIRKDKLPMELVDDLDLTISKEGKSEDEISSAIDKIIQYSVNTDHKFFMNQMYGKQHPLSTYGDILTTILNTSMYTYEVAPVMTMIEKECISKLSSYVWNNAEGDGVFTPGGSFSNMMGLMLARNNKLQNVKTKGLTDSPEFSIFISDQAHYSFTKAAIFMGFGSESIVKIDTNEVGQINTDALRQAIVLEKRKGRTPLMLVGVAGTTFSGVYDDLETLAGIAAENDMWYHIDAVYGGCLMFSEKEQHKFIGIGKANSVSWNLHKMMGVPLICAAFLTRQKGLLNEAFAVNADYLFHDDEDDFNLGQKSLQCGRRVDALKLWLTWKHDGEAGFESRVNKLMNIAGEFASKIKVEDNMELLCQPQSPIVIFRVLDADFDGNEINIFNKIVREQLFKEGEIVFNYSHYKEKIYLRCVISDPELKNEDIDLIIKKIKATANSITDKAITSFNSVNV